jgi:3D (Asp-Asp-Asp) domain-containing protein
MRRTTLALGLLLLATSAQAIPLEGRALLTTYCAKCGGRVLADGTRGRPGTVAADPSVPMGSRVWLQGYGWFVVRDRGPAVTGRHFDRWVKRCPGGCWSHNTGTRRGVKYRIIPAAKKHRKG